MTTSRFDRSRSMGLSFGRRQSPVYSGAHQQAEVQLAARREPEALPHAQRLQDQATVLVVPQLEVNPDEAVLLERRHAAPFLKSPSFLIFSTNSSNSRLVLKSSDTLTFSASSA